MCSYHDKIIRRHNLYIYIYIYIYKKKTISKILKYIYRNHYGTQHVIIRLLEEWRTNLAENKIFGAILLDLPKAFDCIPRDLLIAKLNAYEFDREALKLIFFFI